jgi:hypothetical protein
LLPETAVAGHSEEARRFLEDSRSIASVARRARSNAAQFLAEEVLRFQRVEQEEENEEAELHAHESGEARIGNGCEVMGVEQLPVLSVWRKERVHAGCGTKMKVRVSQFQE